MNNNRRVIVVLGMHRSGTSMATRGLKALGVELGDNLLAPGPDENPKGFWEDLTFLAINEKILATFGLDWHSTTLIQAFNWETPQLNQLKLEAIELIRQRFSQYPIWGFKDPRTVRLLPFWQAVFKHLKIADSYLIVVRNPISVARSLAARNDFLPEKSHLLWLEHALPALDQTKDKARVVVDYDRIIEDPLTQLKRIARDLTLNFDQSHPAIADYQTHFIEANLRHSQFTQQDVALDATISSLTHTAYDWLNQLAQDQAKLSDPKLDLAWQSINQALLAQLPLYRYLDRTDQQLTTAKKQGTALKTALSERDNQFSELTNQFSALNNRLAANDATIRQLSDEKQRHERTATELEVKLATLHVQHSQKELQLKKASEQSAKLQTQLNQAQAKISDIQPLLLERERQIESLQQTLIVIESSRSMKITRPLRWFTLQARRAKLLVRLLNDYRQTNGMSALLQLPFKVNSIFLKQGIAGVRLGARTYAIKTANEPTHLEKESNSAPTKALKAIQTLVIRDAQIVPHRAQVDIIVCVHNALEDVTRCLESVLRYTLPPYALIIVDDGSQQPTRDYLSHFAHMQGATLVRNAQARGYTLAANQGMRQATGDYLILLNSDTIVTPHWLDRLILCAESDPKIGVIGPLSNTASWQSIPEIQQADGDWSANDLPEGIEVAAMGDLVGLWSGRLYPKMGFLNGFCLMIKRQLINEIGYFDEVTFAKGYGEENDFCLRSRKAGWILAVADDTYIFHAQSKSYSHERRKLLSEQAGIALANKHGQSTIDEGVLLCQQDVIMLGIRARARKLFERQTLINQARQVWEGQRVAFVLPIMEACGGSNVVISEALAMRRMGVDARIINLSRHQAIFEEGYPELAVPIIYAASEEDIPSLCTAFDAVIATANISVGWLKPLAEQKNHPVLGYYVQDFEPYFYAKGSPDYEQAWQSYQLIPEMIRLTKTAWNQSQIAENRGLQSELIGPSFNVDLFRPRIARPPNQPLRIVAMIRPETPRRNPLGTVQILREIAHEFPQVEIVFFGTRSDNPAFCSLPLDFNWRNQGVQTAEQLVSLFNHVDIFADFSTFQAMGLTALEAMACGVAVVVPEAGGASSFAVHEQNALIVDTSVQSSCIAALRRLITDHSLRQKLQQRAIEEVVQYYPEGPAIKTLNALFGKAVEGELQC